VIAISYHHLYAHPVPEGHRFPMEKYELIPQQLLRDGIIQQSQITAPATMDWSNISLTHDSEYMEQLMQLTLGKKEQRAIGFELSAQLIERERTIMQGTLDMVLFAMDNGCGLNIAGGTHHAFTNRGEGFCLLNDFAISANYLLKKKLARKILIIDLDVHQGNGTAQIFEQDDRVFTFSIHGESNYPFHKEKSSLDIGLQNGTDDKTYLYLLQEHLESILQKEQPDIAMYQSGVDILSTDKFGKMNISLDGCQQRDAIVFSMLAKENIPCAVAMGGGYSPNLATVVNAHCATFEQAAKYYG
jgi:acetoin utilization deacetylase AcuC-like enzyme